MDSETEMIKHQMEGTRKDLTDKLEMLESQVTDKVKETTETVSETVESVSETVENVKETVEDTVDALKHTFDLQWHARNHPWGLVVGSLVAGFLGQRLLLGGRRPKPKQARARETSLPPAPPPPPPPAPAAREQKPQQEEKSQQNGSASSGGWFGALGQEFQDLKKVGIGMALGVLRDVVTGALPNQVANPLSSAFNSLTEKLGGKTVETDQLSSQLKTQLFGGEEASCPHSKEQQPQTQAAFDPTL